MVRLALRRTGNNDASKCIEHEASTTRNSTLISIPWTLSVLRADPRLFASLEGINGCTSKLHGCRCTAIRNSDCAHSPWGTRTLEHRRGYSGSLECLRPFVGAMELVSDFRARGLRKVSVNRELSSTRTLPTAKRENTFSTIFFSPLRAHPSDAVHPRSSELLEREENKKKFYLFHIRLHHPKHHLLLISFLFIFTIRFQLVIPVGVGFRIRFENRLTFGIRRRRMRQNQVDYIYSAFHAKSTRLKPSLIFYFCFSSRML